MPRAFEGLRVIDFTQVLAGPFAAQLLAMLGADVIKIEQPGTGDQTRGLMAADDNQPGMAPSFLTCNLGKRSVTLNLKAPEARDIVFALVRSADVVIENFKPGVMRRLGFDYDACAAVKRDIVYCSISGYGQRGPKAGLAAYDGAIQAASGMMSITGHPETGPVRTGYMPVDMASALNAAFVIASALYRRRVTGEGQHLDVAMMDTAVVVQAPQMANYLVNGVLPELFGNRSPTKQPTANVFATSDGHIQVIALKETQVKALLDVLGCAASYGTPEFATPDARVANTATVARVLRDAFATNTTSHWHTRLMEADVPVAEIRDLAGVAADEQFAHRDVFAEIARPGRPNETVKVVAVGHTANVDPPIADRAPPRLGEHTDSVLAELGYSKARIADWRTRGVV